jgi:hypothetical protein
LIRVFCTRWDIGQGRVFGTTNACRGQRQRQHQRPPFLLLGNRKSRRRRFRHLPHLSLACIFPQHPPKLQHLPFPLLKTLLRLSCRINLQPLKLNHGAQDLHVSQLIGVSPSQELWTSPDNYPAARVRLATSEAMRCSLLKKHIQTMNTQSWSEIWIKPHLSPPLIPRSGSCMEP